MDEEAGNVPAKSEVEIEREDARQLQQEVERGLAEEPEVIVNPRPVPHIKIQDIEFESIDSTRGSSFDSGGPGGPPSNVNDNIGENGLQSKFACGTWIRNNCTHIRITLILSLLLTLAVTIYMMYTAFTYHYRTGNPNHEISWTMSVTDSDCLFQRMSSSVRSVHFQSW